MLTVMQVLPGLEGGGVERGTVETAAALRAAGHRALVVSAGGRLESNLERLGAEVHRLPVGRKSPAVLFTVRPLARLIREQAVDVVHARSRLPAWVCWWALKRVSPRPVFVTTLHGLNSVSRYSGIMTRADRVIAVSETCRDYWLGHYPALDPGRVEVIHRGIDPEAFPYGHRPDSEWRSAFLSEHGIDPEERLLCLPGRIRRLKGHRALIELLADLKNHGPSVRALVVGGDGRPGYRQELDREADRLGVSDRLIWTGHRADLREIMALSDLVLSLSERPESFGRTVVEALALGRPVAGWDHGGVGEVLARVYPQGRVRIGDRSALADCVRRLLNDPPPVPDRQPFRLEACTSRTLSLYQSLVSKGAM